MLRALSAIKIVVFVQQSSVPCGADALGPPLSKSASCIVCGDRSAVDTACVDFSRWRKALRASGALPDEAQIVRARKQVMLQAHLLSLIPLAAVFLARGFGR